jgi:hypothetical protein
MKSRWPPPQGPVARVTCLRAALVAPLSTVLLISFGDLLSSHPRSYKGRLRSSLPILGNTAAAEKFNSSGIHSAVLIVKSEDGCREVRVRGYVERCKSAMAQEAMVPNPTGIHPAIARKDERARDSRAGNAQLVHDERRECVVRAGWPQCVF